MDCVILGAGGMMPMPARLTTSAMLRKDGRMMMFDAGEGIQIALKRGGIGIRALEVVAISHLHADHVLGLPGILMFRAQCDNPGPLTVVGPRGVRRFIQHTIDDLRYRLNFTINYVEYAKDGPDTAIEWNGGRLRWFPLFHSTLCLGYRFEENTRPGRFYRDKATTLGVPEGPMWGQLQGGQTITLADGRTVCPNDVLGKERRGRVMTFATDSSPCRGLDEVCRQADLAVVEGMFTKAHQKEADEKRHSTAADTARMASRVGVDQLVLVHISPRYTVDEEATLEAEARENFPKAVIGRGLNTFDIPLPD